jgi:hypothetical protein
MTDSVGRFDVRSNNPSLRPPPRKVVLFLDLLGFAKMTEDSPDATVRFPFSPGAMDPANGSFLENASPVGHRVWRFHQILEGAIQEYARSGNLTAMVFSDCAFVAAAIDREPNAHPSVTFIRLFTFAARIMRECLESSIPVRMGIAAGTFQALRFRADTLGDVGFYASQFYGTGVVWSFKAQQAAKGMRIFVHPSLEPEVTATPKNGFEPMVLPLEPWSALASWEIEYLYRPSGKPWHWPQIGDPQRDAELKDERLLANIERMQSAAPQDDKTQRHYLDTIAALSRMRMAKWR